MHFKKNVTITSLERISLYASEKEDLSKIVRIAKMFSYTCNRVLLFFVRNCFRDEPTFIYINCAKVSAPF